MPDRDRAMLIHIARVYLHEARARRGVFHHVLLQWAANARRQAAAAVPRQGDLFGGDT